MQPRCRGQKLSGALAWSTHTCRATPSTEREDSLVPRHPLRSTVTGVHQYTCPFRPPSSVSRVYPGWEVTEHRGRTERITAGPLYLVRTEPVASSSSVSTPFSEPNGDACVRAWVLGAVVKRKARGPVLVLGVL